MGKRKTAKSGGAPETLKGWKAIASYLGIGTAAAQCWTEEGMPVRREGRFMVARTEELRQWLGREAHMAAPAHVVTTGTDVSTALKESIAAVRRKRR